MRAVSVVLVLAAVVVGVVSAYDQHEFDPKWKYACFNKENGVLSKDITPVGFCKGHGVHASSQREKGSKCDCSGVCTVMSGFCVCTNAEPLNMVGHRCKVVSNGELQSAVHGADPSTMYQYACFDTATGKKINMNTKPDGFCGIDRLNGKMKPISYDCEENATCVKSDDGQVYGCQSTTVIADQLPQDHTCGFYSATEISATIRGWPPVSF